MMFDWLRKLLKRLGKTFYQYGTSKPATTEEEAFENWCEDNLAIKPTKKPTSMRVPGPKPGSQAIAKGYGRHMKGKGSKHQLPAYRRSVKARIQPEDEND